MEGSGGAVGPNNDLRIVTEAEPWVSIIQHISDSPRCGEVRSSKRLGVTVASSHALYKVYVWIFE